MLYEISESGYEVVCCIARLSKAKIVRAVRDFLTLMQSIYDLIENYSSHFN